MDTAIKEKWLKALRSGDYTQAKGALRTEEGFCCLGVLCDVIDPEGWTGEDFKHVWNTKTSDYDKVPVYTYGPNRDTLGLSLDVREIAVLEDSEPEIHWGTDGKKRSPITRLNDNEGYDFNQLADIIEEQL